MISKKILSILLAFSLVLLAFPASATDEPQLADGYYKLYTADQLYWFARQVNEGNTSINGKLMADIVINASVLNTDGTLKGDGSNFRVWTPIGSHKYDYSGTFDGNGKAIRGLYITNDIAGAGLFYYVAQRGCVRNLGILDSYFAGNSSIGSVAAVNYGTVEQCYATGSVVGQASLGGVVGLNNGTTKNCHFTGTVTVLATGAMMPTPPRRSGGGGVVGSNRGTISGCRNDGSVTGANSLGGIVGYNEGGTITDCINTGALQNTSSPYDLGESSGGIIGTLYSGTVSNCINIGSITGSANGYGSISSESRVGGICGKISSSITNCFYLAGCVADKYNDGSAMTARQFASGEVCWLLGSAFGQSLGTEPYPALGGIKVYRHQTEDGVIYSNSDAPPHIHSWVNATCIAPKTCSTCGETTGQMGGHDWDAATCTAPKTCKVCSAIEGQKSDHIDNNDDGVCDNCGKQLQLPVEPKPTEPAPTEPAPTEPAPTEPIPTEPSVADPEKKDDTNRLTTGQGLIIVLAAVVVALVAVLKHKNKNDF